MKLLIDANLSPKILEPLRQAGYAVQHVADVGLLTASDEEIFDHAARGDLVVVTADSDFPMLLAVRATTAPSVVHLRHVAELRVTDLASLLVSNLPLIAAELERGAIASLSPVRLAVRDLPLK